jgi:undecaprenyl-diphosphatase
MHFLIIIAAKYLIVLPVLALLWCLYTLRGSKRWELFLLSLISLPAVYLVGILAGHLYYNARPFVAENFSPLITHAANNGFPSDHTLLAAAIAMIVFFMSRRFGIILWIVVFIIGFARVAAGVHHVLDIVGSMLIAIIVVTAVQFVLRRIRRPTLQA